MSCDRILPLLSEYLDDILDTDEAVHVSQHLDQCMNCRREFDRLSMLQSRLRSLRRIQVPEYLHHLVQLRLASARQDNWRTRLRDALEYRWSKIRATEAGWYLTRAMGTVMASVFFFLISSAISPIYMDIRSDIHSQALDNGAFSAAYRRQLRQLGIGVLRNLGLLSMETNAMSGSRSDPKINDLYLLNFGQSVSREGEDDTFSVVTVVDSSGAAKIQDVLEYPADQTLLSNFSSMISSARCRPASENGHAVASHVVMMFSKVSVYD